MSFPLLLLSSPHLILCSLSCFGFFPDLVIEARGKQRILFHTLKHSHTKNTNRSGITQDKIGCSNMKHRSRVSSLKEYTEYTEYTEYRPQASATQASQTRHSQAKKVNTWPTETLTEKLKHSVTRTKGPKPKRTL